jgi:hypothetical protein
VKRLLAILATTMAAASLALLTPRPAAAATWTQNTGMEADANGDGVSDCWQRGGFGTNTFTWSRSDDQANAHDGRFYEKVQITSYSSGDRKLVLKQDAGACAREITPGQTWRVSGYYVANVPTRIAVYYRRGSDGTWVYWGQSPAFAAAATWAQATWVTPAVPVGATHLSFGLSIATAGTMLVDDLSAGLVLPSGSSLLSYGFTDADQLITNQYAYWNASAPGIRTSSRFEMNSGSVFVRQNAGWTGVPDRVSPNIGSTNGTNSAVFRMTTRQGDFVDAQVDLRLKKLGLLASDPQDYDGVHLLLRYQNEKSLYYASVSRRDNTVVIKKKVPGGPSNEGTYYNLTPYVPFTTATAIWQQVRATIRTNTNGTVTIALYVNNLTTPLVVGTDTRTGGAPEITGPGKIGVRADNCEFEIDDLIVRQL